MLFKTYDFLVKLRDQIKEDAVIKGLREVEKEFIAVSREIDTLRKEKLEISERYQELKAKLSEYDNWEQIAKNYTLAELAPGVLVYKTKPGIGTEEPGHCLCTNCFHKKQTSILNRTRWDSSGTVYTCPNCKTEFTDHTKAFDVQLPPVFG